jgi:hypothetical protein
MFPSGDAPVTTPMWSSTPSPPRSNTTRSPTWASPSRPGSSGRTARPTADRRHVAQALAVRADRHAGTGGDPGGEVGAQAAAAAPAVAVRYSAMRGVAGAGRLLGHAQLGTGERRDLLPARPGSRRATAPTPMAGCPDEPAGAEALCVPASGRAHRDESVAEAGGVAAAAAGGLSAPAICARGRRPAGIRCAGSRWQGGVPRSWSRRHRPAAVERRHGRWPPRPISPHHPMGYHLAGPARPFHPIGGVARARVAEPTPAQPGPPIVAGTTLILAPTGSGKTPTASCGH